MPISYEDSQAYDQYKVVINTGQPGNTDSQLNTSYQYRVRLMSSLDMVEMNAEGFRHSSTSHSYSQLGSGITKFKDQNIQLDRSTLTLSNSSALKFLGGGDIFGSFTVYGDIDVQGSIAKQTGTFKINHPNPAKAYKKDLYHSLVESPTEGDNIYRFSISASTDGEEVIQDLPDYWQYLNKNPGIWVNPVGQFANAYGEVIDGGERMKITCEKAGDYKVLLIGTRKDKAALKAWKGVERDRIT